MEGSTAVTFGLIGVLAGIYFYLKHVFGYWERHGIKYVEPHLIFGNIKGMGFVEHQSAVNAKLYNQLKGTNVIAGVYNFIKPNVMAIDPEFIKKVMVKDFNYFHDRGVFFNIKDDPLSGHLFNIEGPEWKSLRSKLSPTFTSGKMKMMFGAVLKVADEFKSYMDDRIGSKGGDIEIKDVLARFTTDVIGTCAFGIECNSLRNPDSLFREMGRRTFEMSALEQIRLMFTANFRDISRKMGLKFTKDDVTEFFMSAVKDTVAYREKNNVQRNDFINLLIQIKNSNKMNSASGKGEIVDTLSLEEMAAQCFVFFLGGFETSSTVMTFCLYELALNTTLQEKTREEIKKVLSKHDDKITYDATMESSYLDQVINETLRKYPPVDTLTRIADRDYAVPEANYTIPKGMQVLIPLYGIHYDPDIYENPNEFNPDRFSEENAKKRHPYTFLPFGEGPRICIGLRFGLMQTRIGLMTLLTNYRITACSKTTIPMVFSPSALVIAPKDGMYLKFEKI